MKSTERLIHGSAIFVLFTALFLSAQAFAGAGDPSSPSLWPLLMPLVSSALGFAAYTLKRLSTANTGFWHQWYGHAAALLGLCLVSSAIDWAASGHLTRMTAIAAGVTAISTFLAQLMPTGKSPASLTIPVQKIGAMLLPLVFLNALSSCSPAFTQCVKASGIGSLSTVENQVGHALSGATDSTSVVSALEGIAAGLLPAVANDAYVLVECAILAWESKNPLPKNASPSPSRYAAYAGASAWIATHFQPVTP